MARKDGFYRVKQDSGDKIMKWTTTNNDNTKEISGYWNGANSYSGNDHDMIFIDERMLTDKEVLDKLCVG